MEIILLHDVEKVGLRGDVVTVADGYARNYLLPRRYAERATPGKVAELRRRDELRARQEARTAEQAEQIAEVLRKTVLRFEVAAGSTGRLFGSVTPTNVADELWRTRKIRIDRRKVRLQEPVKRIGRYEIPIEVFQDVVVEVKTLVVPEGGELPSDDELAAMEAEERAALEPEEAATEAVAEAAAEEREPAGAEDAAEAEAAVAPESAVEPEAAAEPELELAAEDQAEQT